MQIRPFTPADSDELIRLINAFEQNTKERLSAEQSSYRAYADPTSTTTRCVQEFLAQDYLVFVAAEGVHLYGYICGQIKAKPQRVFNKEGYIKHWFVETHDQHHGISRQLFDALVAKFKQADCTHLSVATHLENAAALKIYEHLGFTTRTVNLVKPL